MNTGRIITALAAILAIPAMAADAPGYFKVPGTETSLQVYGRAQTQAWYYLTPEGADAHVGPATRNAYNTATGEKGTVNSNVDGRFGFDSTTPSAYGDVHVKIEYQASNAGSANMRHAYGEFAGVLIGQTDSLFKAWHYSISANDSEDADFNASERTRQIRYTMSPAAGFKIGIAMEADRTSTTTAAASSSGKFGKTFVAAGQYSGDWGGVAASVAFQKSKDVTLVGGGTAGHTQTKRSGNGTSFAVSGQYNITANDTVAARIIKGGSVFGGNAGGFVADPNNANKYKFYSTTSFDLGYTHTWQPGLSTSAGVSFIKAPKNDKLGKVKQTENEFFVNTSYDIVKNVNVCVEYYLASLKYGVGQPVTKINGSTSKKIKESNFNLYVTYNLF